MTSSELVSYLMERESAQTFKTLSDRITASLSPLSKDEALEMIELLLKVSMLGSEGNVRQYGRFMLMAGLEAGRELERRI